MEQQQKNLLHRRIVKTVCSTRIHGKLNKVKQKHHRVKGSDANENTKAFMRSQAEIAKRIEDYNKRPKKTQITPQHTRNWLCAILQSDANQS